MPDTVGFNIDELQDLKRKQLQALCKKVGIKANGKTEDLISQLTDYAQNETPDKYLRNDSGEDSEQEDYESAVEDDGDNDDECNDTKEESKLNKAESEISDKPEADSTLASDSISANSDNPDTSDDVQAPPKKGIEDSSDEGITKSDSQCEVETKDEEKTEDGEVVQDPESKDSASTVVMSHNEPLDKFTSAASPSTKQANPTEHEDSSEYISKAASEISHPVEAHKPHTPTATEHLSEDANKQPEIGKTTTPDPISTTASAPGTSIEASQDIKNESPQTSEAIEDRVEKSTVDPKSETDVTVLDDSISAKIVAELEARTSLLTNEERKAIVESYNTPHKNVLQTPSQKSTKKEIFDRVHNKIFDKYDSIATHWSAKVPIGEARTPSGKRAANAGADGTVGPNKRQKVDPTVTPSNTDRQKPMRSMSVRRSTRASMKRSTIAPAPKTMAAPRTRAEKPGNLSSTKLFSSTHASQTQVRDKPEATSVPSDISTKKQITSDILNPDSEHSLNKDDKAVRDRPAQEPKTNIPVPVTKNQPISKPTAIPSGRAIAKPSSKIASTLANNKEHMSKLQAPTNLHQPPNVKNVESKVKAYINAKPQPKKERAPKQTKPKPKPKLVNENLKPVDKQKKRTVLSRKSIGSDEIPNYMKPTQSAENRSHKANPQVKNQKGAKVARKENSKARFNPYERPSKTNKARDIVLKK